MELQLDSDGGRLRAFLAPSPATGKTSRGLVLCHGVPTGRDALTPTPDSSFTELATTLAGATGWAVLTFDFRAHGKQGAPITLGDWLNDVRAAAAHLTERDDISDVWLAGFSMGGALSICVAGEDAKIRGVAALAAPAELDSWVSDPGDVWPLQSITKIPPRPVLLVQGDGDEIVAMADVRALADAAGGDAELRVLAGAGHLLRHDPRATAVLEGWMDRQSG